MKILKEGNLSKLNKVKKFLCNRCGCLFEATEDEYNYDKGYAYCICPFCHKTIYGELK